MLDTGAAGIRFMANTAGMTRPMVARVDPGAALMVPGSWLAMAALEALNPFLKYTQYMPKFNIEAKEIGPGHQFC